MVSAVVVAAGASTRMGFDKLLYEIDGRPVIWHTVRAFEESALVGEIIIVGAQNMPQLKDALSGFSKIAAFVQGGETRTQSVAAGVKAAAGSVVAIQDGARPFTSGEVIARTVEKALITGAAAPAVPVKDTIKILENGMGSAVTATPVREKLFAVQTPQVFEKAAFLSALKQAGDASFTDDCALMENYGAQVYIVEGAYENIKITTPDDLVHRGVKEGAAMRIGHGYDVHRFAENRKLIIGGVDIPFEKGLAGHSDADVLLHAVSDALLGAAALGDIGTHFPDTAAEFEGADSLVLLEKVCGILREGGYAPGNIDATIVCQRPKLAPYIPEMRAKISGALGLPIDAVGVKATTEEGLGFTGSGEGVAAHAVCTVVRI